MDSIKIDKLYPFKNINGHYCSFEKVPTDFPVSTVSYHTQDSLFIYLNTFITNYLNVLKTSIVDKVYKRGVYNVSKETLLEFYVNPHKVIKFRDVLKLKFNSDAFFKKGTEVKMTVSLTGMWFGESSFGPYLAIDYIEPIKRKAMFIAGDSDSDPEI